MTPEVIDRLTRIEAKLDRMTAEPVVSDAVFRPAEATAYVRKNSSSAFGRWCKKWKVKPSSYGRYSKAQLDLALSREAGLVRVPASIAKAQV